MAYRKFTTKNLYQCVQEQVATRDRSACWPWPYSHANGYGSVGMPGGRPVVRAHRLAFFFETGRWPADKLLHTCDTPSCFNPSHLREGSQADNMADMIAKGRDRKALGVDHHHSKLTEEIVRKIRKEYNGHNGIALGKKYNTVQTNISRIIRREAWKHVE